MSIFQLSSQENGSLMMILIDLSEEDHLSGMFMYGTHNFKRSASHKVEFHLNQACATKNLKLTFL